MYTIVPNLAEYQKTIENLQNSGMIWFRGQSNASYEIVPSLFREKFVIGDNQGIDRHKYGFKKSDAIMKNDIKAIEVFKNKFKILYPSRVISEIDCLYLMQHYGIKTRLLDFTTDPIIALYFALNKFKKCDNENDEYVDIDEKDGYSEKGSSIFCIDPNFLNKESFNDGEIVNLENSEFSEIKDTFHPVAIETDFDEPRIKAQKSKFVFFGVDYKPYEAYDVLKSHYHKIIIPNSARKDMFNEIKQKGYNHFTIYPDLKGLALETNDEIESDYLKRIEKIKDNN
ncbi:FRG domain-containing protein [Elizabethkingia anophelis]|uniref:FRG domain-containing protein n=1 Tax=Elizabethkingia anophelis TaxID=1117645 RepID=UPI00136FEBAD|nr:FRG domain-containing protein [Elizabethkingia anophelis]MYY29525.1 FRG domain-containing protein [Elizabethkingia anophelis]HAY3506933.1 FRG domain-containing protein [Elizabethkingia anophelis]